jgi:hypothetical protein
MTKTEMLAFLGIGLTLYTLLKAKNSDATVKLVVQRPQTQHWAGAGTDPFGTSYTVPGRAARGGL